jgi:hypothetical protein
VHPAVKSIDEPCSCLKHDWSLVFGVPRGQGNGVDARGSKRTATAETADSEPQSSARAVYFNGFGCVMRARWVKTTGRRAAFSGHLIQTNGAQHHALWFCEIFFVVTLVNMGGGHLCAPS